MLITHLVMFKFFSGASGGEGPDVSAVTVPHFISIPIKIGI